MSPIHPLSVLTFFQDVKTQHPIHLINRRKDGVMWVYRYRQYALGGDLSISAVRNVTSFLSRSPRSSVSWAIGASIYWTLDGRSPDDVSARNGYDQIVRGTSVT